MAISSSSTFLYIPGQDSNQQLQMNAALNTNSNILSILTSSASVQGVGNAITNVNSINASLGSVSTATTSFLPQVEALPMIGIFSNASNTPGYSTFNSLLEPISSAYFSTNTELGQGLTGPNYTDSQFSSNSYTTSFIQSTSYTQAEGNWLVSIPGTISTSFNGGYGRNKSNISGNWSRFGVVLGKIGVRPKISLYTSDSNIGVYPFGGVAPIEQFSVNSATYSTWSGGQAYGQVGYNDRTNTLVLLEAKDSNNNYRMHIWRNTNANRSLNDGNFNTGLLNQFLVEAKAAGTPTTQTMTSATGVFYTYNDFVWSTTASSSYNESRYHLKVFPADNGTIGISRFTPSNQVIAGYFTPVPTTAGTAGTMTTLSNSVSTTTSYGIDQGNDYGMRHNQTWDNQWVVTYAPYYYYGSGMSAIVQNTVDPSKYYTWQYASTTTGCQIIPFNKDKFMWNSSDYNSDGNVGQRMWIQDVGGWYANGRDWAGNTVSNGQGMSFTSPQVQYGFDLRYTSTNYPIIVSPGHWTNG